MKIHVLLTPNFLLVQGRALPQKGDSIQSFPDDWPSEFPIIKELGFMGIEWIYDKKSENDNPILSSKGRKEMLQISSQFDIKLENIVFDWFLSHPLLIDDGLSVDKKIEKLNSLIELSDEIGFKHIILPLLEKNEIILPKLRKKFVDIFFKKIARHLDSRNIQIHFETSLPPIEEKNLMDEINHNKIKLCFDMGNSASVSYPPSIALKVIKQHLGSVHIKDRIIDGPSVPLGKGVVNFKQVFTLLKQLNFIGPYSFQVYRDKNSDNISQLKSSLNFINNIMAKCNNK